MSQGLIPIAYPRNHLNQMDSPHQIRPGGMGDKSRLPIGRSESSPPANSPFWKDVVVFAMRWYVGSTEAIIPLQIRRNWSICPAMARQLDLKVSGHGRSIRYTSPFVLTPSIPSPCSAMRNCSVHAVRRRCRSLVSTGLICTRPTVICALDGPGCVDFALHTLLNSAKTSHSPSHLHLHLAVLPAH